LSYIFTSLIIVVFVARIIQTYTYMGYAYVQAGLFYDKICSRGSYEIIVCLPNTFPPYETCLAVLAILLIFSLWLGNRRVSLSGKINDKRKGEVQLQ